MILRIKQEFKELIPALSDSEREQLEQNILSDGIIREPLAIWQGFIVDGHNRYEIAQKHELRFEVHPLEFADENEAKLWMINNQFGRRNLPPFVRAELALKAKPLIAAKAKENQVLSGKDYGKGLQNSAKPIEKTDTRKELSKKAEVSHDTIAKTEKILEKADEETKSQLRSGDISINAAYESLYGSKRKNTGDFHVSQKNNDWYTPPDYIEAARKVLGSIDLDPASSDIAQQKVNATVYYTKETNGLDKEWSGNVWLNPPYSMPEVQDFINKLLDSNEVNEWIVLTNNSSDTGWFHKLLNNSHIACFTKGRIGFIDTSGNQQLQARQGQTFFYKGANESEFIAQFSSFGALVRIVHDVAA